jgi:prepilin-type processing-associated H-X9-DG protein
MKRQRSGFTVIEVVIVLVLIILLIGLTMPQTRHAASRAQETMAINNLKQLGLGMHAHHDTYRGFPGNGIPEQWAKAGDPKSGSWAYRILPYIEQHPAFMAPDAARNTRFQVLLCPFRNRSGVNTVGKYAGSVTDYGINCWLHDRAAGGLASTRNLTRFTEITDGTSNTILIGQLAMRVTDYGAEDGAPWRETLFVGGTGGTGRGGNAFSFDDENSEYVNRFGSPFAGGANFSLCDGSVRKVTYGTDILGALRPDDGKFLEDR